MSREQERRELEAIKCARRRFIRIDGKHFVGIWHVKAGNPMPPPDQQGSRNDPKNYEMRIDHSGGDKFRLCCREKDGAGRWRQLQILEYMPDTNTLENLPGEKDEEVTERCITFWNRAIRNGAGCCSIFAMRKEKEGKSVQLADDLPISETGEEGSWGADDEGG